MEMFFFLLIGLALGALIANSIARRKARALEYELERERDAELQKKIKTILYAQIFQTGIYRCSAETVFNELEKISAEECFEFLDVHNAFLDQMVILSNALATEEQYLDYLDITKTMLEVSQISLTGFKSSGER